MGRNRNFAFALILGSLVVGGCAASDAGTGGDNPGSDFGGSNGSGSGSDGGGNGGDPNVDDGILPTYPTQHPRIYLTPNRARLEAALTANEPAASRFKAKVDSWVSGGDVYNFHAWNGALMGQLTGNAGYCTKAIAMVEAQVVAAEVKIAAGAAPEVAADSYLGIGDMIADLALTYDWCFDKVTSSQRTRWLAYANQAVWNVWHHATARWGNVTIPWTGWAVDDPSDNYYYQFLRATMLLGLAAHGEDAQADTWLAQFRDTKIFGQLIPTFDADLVGGGSREGTGYGVAMRVLWEMYDFWKSTTGESLSTKTRHTRASMLSFIHQLVPTIDRVAPTGDLSRDSTAAFFDYHRSYLQELVQLFPNDPLSGRAKTLLAGSSVPAMTQGFMFAYDLMYDNSNITATPVDGLGTSYYAPGIGEIYSRSGWDTHATWVNMIAGPYTQSHAHQDQGSIMIYKDGWLAFDSVVDSHSGLTQATTAHSLVRIDSGGTPVRQVANTTSTVEALHRGEGWLYTSADLTPAYDGNAAVQKVNREMLYLKPDVVVVFDRVQTGSGTTQTWQLATPVSPAISGNSATVSGAHQLHVQKISGGSSMSVHDFAGDGDYTTGFRLDEAQAGGDQRYLHVLSIDGSVVSSTASGDPAHPGVTIRLSDAREVTIAFNRDTVGASLTIDGATTALGAGVETLPE
jgi:hypothetical protein